jgi:hypothetical protein
LKAGVLILAGLLQFVFADEQLKGVIALFADERPHEICLDYVLGDSTIQLTINKDGIGKRVPSLVTSPDSLSKCRVDKKPIISVIDGSLSCDFECTSHFKHLSMRSKKNGLGCKGGDCELIRGFENEKYAFFGLRKKWTSFIYLYEKEADRISVMYKLKNSEGAPLQFRIHENGFYASILNAKTRSVEILKFGMPVKLERRITTGIRIREDASAGFLGSLHILDGSLVYAYTYPKKGKLEFGLKISSIDIKTGEEKVIAVY